MFLGIGADRDVEAADPADGGGQFGGVGVAVGARLIDAADAAAAGRIATQGDDVIDADGLIAGDHLVHLIPTGVDAGQVRGGT